MIQYTLIHIDLYSLYNWWLGKNIFIVNKLLQISLMMYIRCSFGIQDAQWDIQCSYGIYDAPLVIYDAPLGIYSAPFGI